MLGLNLNASFLDLALPHTASVLVFSQYRKLFFD